MTTPTPQKKRPQRVASDTAHSWARNLRLNNPLAKLVLSMITLYVQGDGVCFVGVPLLAEDCELSHETVRRRLGWLETVGVLVRMPQWLDENGRRNGDGRGKRTTDEIRLLIDADQDVIEARASGLEDGDTQHHDLGLNRSRGQTGAESADDSTASETPSYEKNLTQDSISPLAAPSLRRRPESLEPEPEPNPPTPPSGGGGSDWRGIEESWPHQESWANAEMVWGEPIIHQTLCRQIWSSLSDQERERFIAVERGYNAWRTSQKRPPNRCNLQKLMRERDAWPKFEQLAPAPPKPSAPPAPENWIEAESVEFHALGLMREIARLSQLKPFASELHSGSGVKFSGAVPHGAEALAELARSSNPSQWNHIVEKGSKPFFAWAERISEWIGRTVEGHRIWLDEHDCIVATAEQAYRKPRENMPEKWWSPKCKDGLLVPCEWPPPKGTGKHRPEDELKKTG